MQNRDVEIELGIWLSGLRCFVTSGPNAFFSGDREDRSREARVLHSSLVRAAMLAAMVLDPANESRSTPTDDLHALSDVLRDAIYTGEGLINGTGLSTDTYNAWCGTVASQLMSSSVVDGLTMRADAAGARDLPAILHNFTLRRDLTPEESELALVLPRFGRVLLYLDVIGGMLERDEPLKPAILIFTRVNELIHELTTFINNRLERFPDADADLYGTLDAASYTASMEMKKVYSQELAGVVQIRNAPSIFARTETAYASLSDGFKLILAGFAKIVDPSADMFAVFPEFTTKRDQSMVLRRELSSLIKAVNTAEKDPSAAEVEMLNSAIREFMLEPVTYLFYKDTETIERFVEEIATTPNNKDLVPLLHRFGAYLDTLLGQVALRSVLTTTTPA